MTFPRLVINLDDLPPWILLARTGIKDSSNIRVTLCTAVSDLWDFMGTDNALNSIIWAPINQHMIPRIDFLIQNGIPFSYVVTDTK